jgi:hypothetical protein
MRKVPKIVLGSSKSVNRLHVAFGTKLVINAEGLVGIVALVVLVVGFAFVAGGLHWTLPLPW